MSADGSPQARRVGPPPLKSGSEYVNPGEEDQMEIIGYKRSLLRTFFTWCAIVLTLGGLRLVFHWRRHWMLVCTHTKTSLMNAEKVLLIDQFNQIFVEMVQTLTSRGYDRKKFRINGVDKPSDIESYGAVSTPELLRPRNNGKFEMVDSLRLFDCKKVRYLWTPESGVFLRVSAFDRNIECAYFHSLRGITAEEQKRRSVLYGKNEIQVRVQTVIQILFNEVLGPFYVFQVFSIILWGFEDYVMYASCIIVMSALSLISSVIQIRKNQQQLRDTVVGADMVTVQRENGSYEDIESMNLVPGDVIVIPPHGCVMQTDAVLVSGNTIVNESMLTGESVPVTKTPLPDEVNDMYDTKEHAKHTLFCGTKVIQTRFYDGAKVKAIVVRTGFQTAKGELVRSIMFPKPVDFKFNRHIYKFIQYLCIVALAGFVYTVVLKASRHVPLSNILLKSLDLITIVIPPALPMAMTIGVVFAQSRLKKSLIYCISPRTINISGCINCVCFDKTGTLTEDDLSFSEVLPVSSDNKSFEDPVHDLSLLPMGPLITCLASCHSLTLIDESIIGDPLDQKMFAATGWSLEEPAVDDTTKYDLLAPTVVKPPSTTDAASSTDSLMSEEVGILRQFPFSSSLQRMSVVARNLTGSQFEVYVKGAPEVIVPLSIPETVPDDFDSVLKQYTQKGYRVLALAYRPLATSYVKMQRAARDDLESNLSFLGLLIMGNMLKPETTSVIDVLLGANIRCVMVTGDNMLTALSVARECHMIQPDDKVVLMNATEVPDEKPMITWSFADHAKRRDSMSSTSIKIFTEKKRNDEKLHVAVTGKTFRILREFYPELLKKVAIRGTVFSRMAPDQKQQLIELLQDLGYYVGMCGDGANDCGALKAAHAGVSLSETEASVASPFTSKTANISCIPILIREGRTSLVTAFGILKYMACYSLCQFSSVILLYYLWSNLTDFQFLYQDLFLISLFCVVFGRTESFRSLGEKAPPSSLIGITPLLSLLFQVLIIIGFQLLAAFLLWRQPFYQPAHPDSPDALTCQDNYAIFAVSVFQYITLAFVFSKGAPYRKPIYTNYGLIISLIAMTVFTAYLVISPAKWISDLMEFDLEPIAMDFRIMMVCLAGINFVLAFFFESFVVDYLVFIHLKEWLQRVTSSQTAFEKISRETETTHWLPPSSSPSNSTASVHGVDIPISGDQKLRANGTRNRVSPPESGICVSIPASALVSPSTGSLTPHPEVTIISDRC